MDRGKLLETGEVVRQWEQSGRRGSFGPLGNVAANGCGSVALYHALRLLGQPVRYENVLKKMNREWYKSTVAGGLLGTNPLYLWRVIRRVPGVRCHISVYVGTTSGRAGRDRNAAGRDRNADDRAREDQIYVNLYLHRHGAHYTVSEYRDGRFHVYNDQCGSGDHAGYFKESGALAMIVMRIVQKEES